MYRTLLERSATAGAVLTAGLWLACATIPNFVVGSGADSAVPDGSVADGARPDTGNSGEGDAGSSAFGYRFFVTSETYPGSFGSDGGADVVADGFCQARADAAKIGGVWKAFFSPASNQTPAVRFVPVAGGWHQVLPSSGAGALIFDALTDNISARSTHPVLTEYGISSTALVWTGGTIETVASHCDDWRKTGGEGTVGKADGVGGMWMKLQAEACSNKHALYCIEMPR